MRRGKARAEEKEGGKPRASKSGGGLPVLIHSNVTAEGEKFLSKSNLEIINHSVHPRIKECWGGRVGGGITLRVRQSDSPKRTKENEQEGGNQASPKLGETEKNGEKKGESEREDYNSGSRKEKELWTPFVNRKPHAKPQKIPSFSHTRWHKVRIRKIKPDLKLGDWIQWNPGRWTSLRIWEKRK